MSEIVDDVRLSDLGPLGVGGLVLVAYGVGYIAYEGALAVSSGGDVVSVALGGTLLATLGALFAYESGAPEYEGTCDNCGSRFRNHTSRDTVSESVRVNVSGAPRRLEWGPLSMVLHRQTAEYAYCSGECAERDTRTGFRRDKTVCDTETGDRLTKQL